MNVITYSILLLEPLLATRIEGDPNAGVSYPFVPGSLVRGALAGVYQRKLGLRSLDAADPVTRDLLFNGQTRFLNAYPSFSGPDGSRTRLLPTPHSWHTLKGSQEPIYDFAVELPEPLAHVPHASGKEDSGTVVQYKALQSSQPFCRLVDGKVLTESPQRQVTVHTARDRVYGRAREGSGAVFQYDALAPEQTFVGVILCDGEYAQDLEGLLVRLTTLGGSANGGYGRVRIENVQVHRNAAWRETPGVVLPVPAGEAFVVTLLSDTILRDRVTGLPTTDLCSELSALLNATVQSAAAPQRRSAVRMAKVGGFNRRWGLPLMQTQCLAAGSVLVVKSDKDLAAASLADLERRGVGERRAEGFGRLAFQWQTYPVAEVLYNQVEATIVEAGSEAPVLDGNALKLGMWLAERLLRQELDGALQRCINATAIVNPPQMAQLSRLRVIARDTMPQGDVDRLLRYVQAVGSRRSSREQFQRARIDGKRLNLWLEEHLREPSRIWRELNGVQTSRKIASNGVAVVDEVLEREYTIRLIDALFAKAAQERRQQEDNR